MGEEKDFDTVLSHRKCARNCSKAKAVMAILKTVINCISSNEKIFSPHFFNFARTGWGIKVAFPHTVLIIIPCYGRVRR
jgi:hypothetical protein